MGKVSGADAARARAAVELTNDGLVDRARGSWLLYPLLLVSAAIGVSAVLLFSRHLAAPEAAPGVPRFGSGTVSQSTLLFHILLALLAIVLASRGLGRVFRRLGQPQVVGEVVAGILLGPSFLGRIAPELGAFVLPLEIVPSLGVLAQVGAILFMFLVGLEFDSRLLRDRTHTSVLISHTSIIVPFLLGVGLAVFLYPRLSTADVPFFAFALFSGVAMSITAFPVLARILTDVGLAKTPLGVTALTCAAVDDVTAWCLLAFVVSSAQARLGSAVITLGFTVLLIGTLVIVVRPLALRGLETLEARAVPIGRTLMAMALGTLLLVSLLAEGIGIHAVFGAFLVGAVIPCESSLAVTLRAKLEDIVLVMLLPPFFAYTGMRTELQLVSGAANWAYCALIVVVACAGKIGGTLFAARKRGLPWRDAWALGALMNTRGLVQLVVLNIGLDLHVISPTLFAMMVVMAVVTTFATSPALTVIMSTDPRRVALNMAVASGLSPSRSRRASGAVLRAIDLDRSPPD
ncbi:MAG TPA: cation:proton antiporter [Candidatus Binatia bacterium]|nr:cation:proton antiporter [Candidatus Binatia bacterium]